MLTGLFSVMVVCGRVSLLPINFLLHLKYSYQSYCIIAGFNITLGMTVGQFGEESFQAIYFTGNDNQM